MAEDPIRQLYTVQKRLEKMGLSLEPAPGGRSLCASLQLGPAPFAMPEGPRSIATARFFTVGYDRIKFIAPRAFAYLPLIHILDCGSSEEIEGRLRAVWQQWMETLARSRRWLEGLGVVPASEDDLPLCYFPLGPDSPRARVTVLAPSRVVLPSREGSHSGAAGSLAERVYETPVLTSIAELSFDLSVRLERLARARRHPTARLADRPRATHRQVPLLLVGVRFLSRPAFAASLTALGCACHVVRSISEALEMFRQRTFEGVLVDAQLDRADGTELIPALRSLPGILELPIAIYDDRPRPNRRQAAKRAGAAAYLAGSLHAERLAPILRHIVSTPRRRFRRYPATLAVSWPGCESPATTATVGRAGFSLRTAQHLADGLYSIHVADSPHGRFRVVVDAEFPQVNFGDDEDRRERLGARFRAFHEDSEAKWIAYLDHLHEHRLEHLSEQRGQRGD